MKECCKNAIIARDEIINNKIESIKQEGIKHRKETKGYEGLTDCDFAKIEVLEELKEELGGDKT
ncbi:MAG TPA: hypothetical protein V6C58_04625 [Allocoleopsis sp.]